MRAPEKREMKDLRRREKERRYDNYNEKGYLVIIPCGDESEGINKQSYETSYCNPYRERVPSCNTNTMIYRNHVARHPSPHIERRKSCAVSTKWGKLTLAWTWEASLSAPCSVTLHPSVTRKRNSDLRGLSTLL